MPFLYTTSKALSLHIESGLSAIPLFITQSMLVKSNSLNLNWYNTHKYCPSLNLASRFFYILKPSANIENKNATLPGVALKLILFFYMF